MSDIEVRPATEDDLPVLREVIPRAFSNDPPMSWIFRDPSTRVERLQTLFGGALVEIFHPAGHLWTTADAGACAVWQPPGQWRTPDEVVERITPPLRPACSRRSSTASSPSSG